MKVEVDIQKFKSKQCSRCGAPLNDHKHWLCDKCRAITCPIRFDPEVDSKEVIAQKWKEIKQWYKDHPEAQAPWEEYEDNMRKLKADWDGDSRSKLWDPIDIAKVSQPDSSVKRTIFVPL